MESNFIRQNGLGHIWILNNRNERQMIAVETLGYFYHLEQMFFVHRDIQNINLFVVTEASTGCNIFPVGCDSIRLAVNKAKNILNKYGVSRISFSILVVKNAHKIDFKTNYNLNQLALNLVI